MKPLLETLWAPFIPSSRCLRLESLFFDISCYNDAIQSSATNCPLSASSCYDNPTTKNAWIDLIKGPIRKHQTTQDFLRKQCQNLREQQITCHLSRNDYGQKISRRGFSGWRKPCFWQTLVLSEGHPPFSSFSSVSGL